MQHRKTVTMLPWSSDWLPRVSRRHNSDDIILQRVGDIYTQIVATYIAGKWRQLES